MSMVTSIVTAGRSVGFMLGRSVGERGGSRSHSLLTSATSVHSTLPAEPSRAEPSRAEPSRAEPSRAFPVPLVPSSRTTGTILPPRVSIPPLLAALTAAER